MRNAATLSVTGSSSLCQLSHRESQERWAEGRNICTTLQYSAHPLASPYGGGGRPNGLTERVPTFVLLHSASEIRNAATLSVTGSSSLCQLSQRESQVGWRKAGPSFTTATSLRSPPKGEPRALGGRSEHLYRPTTFCPPTCLPLWGRWQAERPDGEGAHGVLLDQRFLNMERRYPLSHRLFEPVPALPKGEPRALGGRSEHLYRPTTFCPPTCLPLWERQVGWWKAGAWVVFWGRIARTRPLDGLVFGWVICFFRRITGPAFGGTAPCSAWQACSS